MRPEALVEHYSAFRVSERVLLTGHSHQAWPDVGFEAQKQAWLDAAELVDGKWTRVSAKVERVSEGYRTLMGGCDGDFTLDANTHALVVRLLSALPLRERPRIVTTDAEFHSIRRQLDRLSEDGLEVVRVVARPVDTLPERLAAEVDDRTSAVLVSSVLYASALIVPHLGAVAEACAARGAELLIDAYHSLGAVPFSLDGAERAFVVGGGYKYLQLGEGNCALRVPPDCAMRPAVTGWFAEFAELAESRASHAVAYGAGAARFAGSTFDPVSPYRAAAVMDFFEEQGLTTSVLRSMSQAQVGRLVEGFRALDLDPARIRLLDEVPADGRAGFLALWTPDAEAISHALLEQRVHTDFRGEVLRLGPAPYVTDAQLDVAIDALGTIVRARG